MSPTLNLFIKFTSSFSKVNYYDNNWIKCVMTNDIRT